VDDQLDIGGMGKCFSQRGQDRLEVFGGGDVDLAWGGLAVKGGQREEQAEKQYSGSARRILGQNCLHAIG